MVLDVKRYKRRPVASTGGIMLAIALGAGAGTGGFF